MPYKNPADRRAWRKKNRERLNAEMREWYRGPSGQRLIARQKENAAANRKPKQLRLKMPKDPNTQKRYRSRLRVKAIQLMGACCAHCGNGDLRVLQFDHIVQLCRRSNGLKSKDSAATHRRIVNDPESRADYQLLCANCHVIKTRENDEYTTAIADDEERCINYLPLFDA